MLTREWALARDTTVYQVSMWAGNITKNRPGLLYLCHDVVEGKLIRRVCLQFKMVGLRERSKINTAKIQGANLDQISLRKLSERNEGFFFFFCDRVYTAST